MPVSKLIFGNTMTFFIVSGFYDVADLKKHARVLKLDGARFDACLDNGEMAASVRSNFKGEKLFQLSRAPHFVVNGHFFSGVVDYNSLKQMIDQQLAVKEKLQVQAKLL